MAHSPMLFALAGAVRTLPVRCKPQPGEAFTSYMERLAQVCEVPLSLLVSKTGLIRQNGQTSIPGWGVTMTPTQMDVFCSATRLDEKTVKPLLLSIFNGTFANLTDVDSSKPYTVQRAAVHEWLIINGSRFCPACLAEEPHTWLLRWKLNWSFACVKHETLLMSHCDDCGRPSGLGRGDKTATPAYLGKVARLGCCRNIRAKGSSAFGMASTPCGAELWKQGLQLVPGVGRVLNAQTIIDQHVENVINRKHNTESSLLTWASTRSEAAIRLFSQDTRSLSALILQCGKSTSFCVESNAMQQAVDAHINERAHTLQAQTAGGRYVPKRRVYTRNISSSALAAASLTPAVEIANIHDHEALVQALMPLASFAREHGNIHNRQLARDFHFSDRLSDAFNEATTLTGSLGRTSSHYPSLRVAQQTDAFGPRHIPQTMPLKIYESHFQSLLPGVLSPTGQRFCAMAALKSFGMTWVDAASHLELPTQAVSYVKKAVPLLNRTARHVAFVSELAKWIKDLKSAVKPVDYQARRQLLRQFSDIPLHIWEEICTKSLIRTGEIGRRSRYAAAWLWADLTQGDWRLSPAMDSLIDHVNAREIYTRLVKLELAPALTALSEAGQAILLLSETQQIDALAMPN